MDGSRHVEQPDDERRNPPGSEEALEEALIDSFPASDPVGPLEPAPRAPRGAPGTARDEGR